MVMGHELTHGFDNTGRQFDKQGNLHNWWNEASSTAFIERSQCMINQYNSFTVEGKNVSTGGYTKLSNTFKLLCYS